MTATLIWVTVQKSLGTTGLPHKIGPRWKITTRLCIRCTAL